MTEPHGVDPNSSGETTEEPAEGTFLVTHAEEDSVVLRHVETARVHTLAENPGVDVGDVLDARLEPQPPMGVTWQLTAVDDRRNLRVEYSDLEPTAQERELAADQSVGAVTRTERADHGELHVITVPPERTEQAAQDVVDDDATLVRAAGIENVRRVEVRASEGVVSVRYLP